MRAVVVNRFGGPEVLEVAEREDPVPARGEVRIRVHAAAVNPTDTGIRSGKRTFDVPPPYVPGMDAAGVLDRVGEGAETSVHVGDHVMAIVVPAGASGAYAEYVVVPADSMVAVPAGATDVYACTLPMNGLTARMALDRLGLAPGQTVAVTGAAGAFGGYVIQLAKADGLRVIADASAADHDLVAGLGADVVVDRGPEVAARIREVAPGGVDGVADGALLHALVLPAVRDDGGVAAVRPFEGSTERGITIHQIRVRDYARERDKLDRLRQQVEAGEVTLRVARSIPASEAPDAHRLLEAGGIRGRVVLLF